TAVLCREDAPRAPPAGLALMDEAFVASAVRAEGDPFDPRPEVEERFVGPYGSEVRVSSALAKMAMLILASIYPRARSLDALVADARERLGALGIAPDADEPARLRVGLFELWQHLEVELRLEDAALGLTPGQRPVASALARYEARSRPALTTPVCSMLPIEPIDREI